MRWLHQVCVALDQLLNAICGGFADETISAKAYRVAEQDRKDRSRTLWIVLEHVINFLFIPQDWWVKIKGEWTGERHCRRAFVHELERRQYPPQYRNWK